MTPRPLNLPAGRVWLRVAKPDWADPLDPGYAKNVGGRWNPPNSFPTLYLSGNVITARLQIERMCAGTPITPDDLADDAYMLVAATLPSAQPSADAVTEEGLIALGLPTSYPLDDQGHSVSHATCQPIGASLEQQGRSGIWCRSACSPDGHGRELAWFSGSQRAAAVWNKPLPFGLWRHADTWHDVELADQRDPTN